MLKGLESDIVMDMLCFTVDSARLLVESLRGSLEMLLHCGTIWVHGPSARVPTTEETPRCPMEPYGSNKALVEEYDAGKSPLSPGFEHIQNGAPVMGGGLGAPR